MIKPSYERIKFLQNQLRTAIQNHHVLLLKSKLTPQDTEIKNQMNILQSLIISMGRTQNELLDQLERELENSVVAKADVGRHLSWYVPKNVPIFLKSQQKAEVVKNDENTPVVTSKAVIASKPCPRVYSRMHSLLKPKESSASDVTKSDEVATVWKNPKKLQSVLKPKPINDVSTGFIRISSETIKICGDVSVVSDNGANEDGLISPKRRKTTDSEPNSRSNSVSPKPMSAPKVQEIRRKVVESKLWTRSKRKMAVEAAAAAAKAASFSGNSEKDINDLEESLKNEPIDPNLPTDEKILRNLSVYEAMGKAKFLESFSLISLSERDVLKAKKGGRKRRTAAGQSNFYNDYFQHSALSMKNPKWRYEMQPVRRAPRDSNKRAALLEGSRRGSSPPDAVTSGEVTPEEKASPPRDLVSANSICDPPLTESRRSAPSGTANPKRKTTISDKGDDDSAVNNSIVVEATELEEDDKDKLCILCRTAGDDSVILEVCVVCGEKYHSSCATADNEGRCTLCLAQISGFKTIVGGETGVSSSSSLEVIKRYLPS